MLAAKNDVDGADVDWWFMYKLPEGVGRQAKTNKSAMVVETDLGQQRRQYRVYLGPYRSRDKSNKTCKVLKRLGMGCSIIE